MDDAPFHHVIMTRFNLATPGRESALRNRPGWLAERFDLFERYCLPSVAAQTERRFHWIVYFDADTPEPFRARIEACRAVQPFTPYFTPLFPAEGWPRSVRETLDAPAPWLLTTRLDNDDALAADFVARLRAAALEAPLRRGALNFTNGYIMAGGRLYAHSHPSNAFASWLEPWDEAMRTAPSIAHMEFAEHGPVRQIGGAAAWMQIVHGGNVSNKVRGRLTAPDAARGRFPDAAVKEAANPGLIERLVENGLKAPLRAVRDRVLDIGRRLFGKGAL